MNHQTTEAPVPVQLQNLTPEQRKQLFAELQKEKDDADAKIKGDRQAYKNLVNETLPACFTMLQETSKALSVAKSFVYNSLATLVKMKGEVYDKESDQYTHSFTTDKGINIVIGYRLLDGWDDTVTVGIQKVNECLTSFGKDEDSQALIKGILKLLSKDAKGTLKASRVLQLKKMAEDMQNPELLDAIAIIQDAYRPTPTKQFVSASYKGEKGEKIDLGLSITDVELIAPEHHAKAVQNIN